MNGAVMRRAQCLILGLLWALSACKGASTDSSTKKKDDESAKDDEGNGSIDVKYEKEKTTFKVGTAYAMPQPFGDDGVLYTFFVYNDGVKDPPCTDELFPSDPVGGNNWADSFPPAASRSSPSRQILSPSSSPNSTKAATVARHRRRWCSSGCWQRCCATRRLAS